MINIELSFINKNLLKKNARFQKYDSKEPGGVQSTTVILYLKIKIAVKEIRYEWILHNRKLERRNGSCV